MNMASIGDLEGMGRLAFKLPKIRFGSKKKQIVALVPSSLSAQSITGRVRTAVQRQGWPRWIVSTSMESNSWVFMVNPAAVGGASDASVRAMIAAAGQLNPTEMMLVQVRYTRPMAQAEAYSRIGIQMPGASLRIPGMYGVGEVGSSTVKDAAIGAGIGLVLALVLKRNPTAWAGIGAAAGVAKNLLAPSVERILALEEPEPKSGLEPRESMTA